MTALCRRSARVAAVALLVPAVVAVATQAALAQNSRPGPVAPAKPHPAAHPAPKRTAAPAASSSSASPAPPAGATLPVATDAGVIEAKTLDGGTHVFKFSELDIEGRLKSPQLVYFLRRVRAEFAAGDLGHRSFMREMSETRKEPTF